MKKSAILFVILILLIGQRSLFAVNYGDVSIQEVSMTSDVGGRTGHGYVEYRFRITNRDTKTHQVGIEMPKTSYGYSGTTLARSSNTAEIPPKSTVMLRLLQPPVQMEGNGDAQVIIDGRYQRDSVPFSKVNNHINNSGTSHEIAHILTSKDVPGDLRDMLQNGVPPEKKEEAEGTVTATPVTVSSGVAVGGGGPIAVPHYGPSRPPELVPWTSNVPVEEWSDYWLAYTRFDAVVLTSSEWKEIQEQHAGIYEALRKYTESGGMLGIVGTDWTAPKEWVESSHKQYQAMLGLVYVMPKDIVEVKPGIEPFRDIVLKKQAQLWRNTIGDRGSSGIILSSDATLLSSLPVVANYGVNVKLIMVLIVVFAVLIGPVNIYALSLMKRRIWLLWTVPVTSLVASMLVLGVSFFQEGLLRQSSSVTCTILDQRREEAISFGYVGFYSTLTPRGILFSPDTEATACMERGYGSSRSLEFSIVTGGNQFLTRGWISARVPSYFAIRKAQSQRKERLTFDWAAEPSATNGLGVDLNSLRVRSPKGKLYTANGVKAGQKVVLTPYENDSGPASMITAIQNQRANYNALLTSSIPTGSIVLPASSYVAEINGWNPFVEEGIDRTKPYQNKTTIFGLFE